MIVIDASVAIKWIEKERDSNQAYNLQRAHLTKQNEIIVPQLLFYEIANTLVTKSHTTQRYIEAGLNIIYDTHLIVEEITKDILFDATRLANKYKTTVYDMLYVIIAKKHKIVLVTADERFVQLTKFSFVKLLSVIQS